MQAKLAALGGEPTLIIQSIDAGLQVLQVSLLDIPTWAHAIIAAVIVLLAALTNRQAVVPTTKLVDPALIAVAPTPPSAS